MTTQGPEVSAAPTARVVSKGRKSRQQPLGPAPFASFEADSSDELDSPPESARAPGLPNITEDPASHLATPVSPAPPDMNKLNLTEEEERGLQEALAASLDTPAPPRIDISRASSSSQHEDSITSSPDADAGHNLGYKEDGTLELKSSTEELYYTQEPGTVEEGEAKRRREKRMQKQVRQEFDTQSEHDFKERKDSNCSVASDFGGHLNIGGRTSRLSSVGSAASGNSIASGTSRLSARSNMSSRGSRSPSPHKMMLETSFCGGKPAAAPHVADANSAPALVSHMERPSSRPPSRLRSRSPSPHKVLLETSFCGPKALHHSVAQASQGGSSVVSNRRKSSVSNQPVPESADIPARAEAKRTVSNPIPISQRDTNAVSNPIQVSQRESHAVSKPIPIKPPESRPDEIRSLSPRPRTRKPVNLAAMMERKIALENKPKKVYSIRDIPGDEIMIPLTGPELDFDELIRKSSPRMPRKEPSEDTPDVIYIPLHSPPKEKEVQIGAIASEKEPRAGGSSGEPKPYEVCEDGSIFIPLHTPEEERNARTFEEQIKRVEIELQRVKAAEAEKREREREQQKPATLDLHDATNNRSRLSQSYPGKQDFLSGSRTPSPGSSLSRKSSFASIFRRSELTASPDSPAGHTARKKSGTLSNILNATDGMRERSRSRSKERSRERLSSSTTVSRSPSFKKNVLGGLFGGKKKEEPREMEPAPRIHVQPVISTAKFQGQDMGDYIFIPLRDPNDPRQDSIEQDTSPNEPQFSETRVEVNRELSGLSRPGDGTGTGDPDVRSQISDTSIFHLATVGAAYKSPQEEKSIESQILPSSNSKQSLKSNKSARPSQQLVAEPEEVAEIAESQLLNSETSEMPVSESEPQQAALSASHSIVSETLVSQETPVEVTETKIHEDDTPPKASSPELQNTVVESAKPLLKPHGQEESVQDSSMELDDDLPREEIVTVSTDGIRKLKLPPEPGDLDEDHERKGLVVQDSLEEELPYVPTTLPLERPCGVTLVPAKERHSEVLTCPIDRPRSTTPKNPTSLEDYLARRDSSSVPDKEKMKISLPRADSTTGKVKSPRRFSGKGKTWFEFAEAGIPMPRKNSLTKSPSPPPLPPRAEHFSASPGDGATSPAWINFEELPEKRKLPKRITTLPVHRAPADGGGDKSAPVVYSYVNPEDCQCECHDNSSAPHSHTKKLVAGTRGPINAEDSGGRPMRTDRRQPMSAEDDRRQPMSIELCDECDCDYQQVDVGARELEERPLLDGNSDDESISKRENEWPGSRLEVEQRNLSDSSFEAMSIGPDHSPGENGSEMIPFAMDLDCHSNRSSIISQNDEQSPDRIS